MPNTGHYVCQRREKRAHPMQQHDLMPSCNADDKAVMKKDACESIGFESAWFASGSAARLNAAPPITERAWAVGLGSLPAEYLVRATSEARLDKRIISLPHAMGLRLSPLCVK